MWASKPCIWFVLIWLLMSSCHRPVAGLLRYTAAVLFWLRRHLSELPPPVLNHLDIARLPCRRYIHRGSRRNFHQDNSKAIKSFWSTSHRPLRKTAQFVDQTALASLARSANATVISLLTANSTFSRFFFLSSIMAAES